MKDLQDTAYVARTYVTFRMVEGYNYFPSYSNQTKAMTRKTFFTINPFFSFLFYWGKIPKLVENLGKVLKVLLLIALLLLC